MRLNIEGKSYGDIIDSVGAAALGDLVKLKKHSGVTVKSIKEAIDWSFKESVKPEFDALDLLSNDVFLVNMIGAIWLSKRKAGEEVTIDSVERLPFGAFHFEWDEEADVEAPKEVAEEVESS